MRKAWRRLPLFTQVGSVFIVFIIATVAIYAITFTQRYAINQQKAKLLSKVSVNPKLIKEDNGTISYNRTTESPKTNTSIVLSGTKEDSTGKQPFQASLSKSGAKTITFSNSSGDLGFSMTPNFATSSGELHDGRVIYPNGFGTTDIYTFKRNGLKEDIILSNAPSGGKLSRSWTLDLGTKLIAKLQPNGSIGIYSADPILFGEFQSTDDKSQKLIENAKAKGEKTYLSFVIPAPNITDSNGKTTYSDAKFELSGNTLTLNVKNLSHKKYPLSIDPSVVVTTNADFAQGSDDGMIAYPGAGNVSRSNISAGVTGGYAGTSSFINNRNMQTTVASKGFIYLLGGYDGSTYYNDVQYASINSDGTLGTWQYTYNSASSVSFVGGFTTARGNHSSVIYNNYIYVIGGTNGTNQNDVQYAPINADGTLGTWASTTAFTAARSSHSSVAYNGFLYVIGGVHGTSDTACNATASLYCSYVQYAPIGGDGTIGSWTATTAFTTARSDHTSIAYNGFLYVVGGFDGVYYATTQYAPINADGTIGTWTASTSFTTARSQHTTVASSGYIYVIGGTNGTRQNDVQYSPLNANGSIGTWATTTAFVTIRSEHSSVVYNGYLYIAGGIHTTSDTACSAAASLYCSDIQYAQILAPTGGSGGISGTFATSTSLSVPRSNFGTAAFNGYLYVTGGVHATSDTACNATASLYCSDVLYAIINADGTIGSWAATTSLPSIRDAHSSFAYNGFLYSVGGFAGAGTYLNDVLYAPINSTGTIGSWTAANAFAVPRQSHTSLIANGYMYVLGGVHAASDTLCNGTASTFCSDVQYALICTGGNSGTAGCSATAGTVGTWSTTTNFPTARNAHTSVTYNGYIYVIGGQGAAYLNDIQYALLCTGSNSGTGGCGATAGTVGTWASAGTAFASIRDYHTSVVANGYLYVMGGWNGTTYYNDVQYATINAAGTIGAWATTTAFTTARYGHGSVFYNNKVYIIAGYHATSDTLCSVATSNYCSNVQYSELKPGQPTIGTTGTYATTTALAVARAAHASIAYNGYLYVMGGDHGTSDQTCVNTGVNNTACNDVLYASLNANGTIGSWASTTNFPVPRLRFTAAPYNGFMYIISGVHPTSDTACNSVATAYCNDVEYAPINANGTVGAWNATTILPVARQQSTSVAYNGYLYVLGGYHPAADTACGATSGNNCQDVSYALLCTGTNNGTGGCGATAGTVGTWARSTDFPVPRSVHTAVASNGFMYVVGGVHLASDTLCTAVANIICQDVRYAPINADGTVGTWARSTDLPAVRKNQTTVISNGFMYDIGGCSAGSCTTAQLDVQYAPVNADGSVGTWAAATSFATARYQHTSVAANGYLYVVAGCTAGNCTAYRSDIQYANLNSISRKAKYEKTIDIGGAVSSIDSTVFGGNLQCGAQVSYSMAGSDGVFGTVYSLPNVLGGKTYTLTSMASPRYVRIIATMDDSNCGGTSYISDITVNFTVVPSAPTLITPANSFIGSPLLPLFQLRSSHPLNYYLRYKIDVCTTSNCSSVLRTIDQTASQTGWTGQDAQTSTAYNSSSILSSSTIANHTYQAPALTASTQYWWRAYAIDPLGSNAFTAASAISTFTTNTTPAVPTLNGATRSVSPQFNLRTTDPDSDYMQYKIILYQSDCTTVVSTIDQTTSQAGWSGQDQQNNTGYATSPTIGSSTVASYTYIGTLSANTTYCWKAAAIDPAGLNTFTAFSGTQTFTTATALNSPTILGGGLDIRGGTRFGN